MAARCWPRRPHRLNTARDDPFRCPREACGGHKLIWTERGARRADASPRYLGALCPEIRDHRENGRQHPPGKSARPTVRPARPIEAPAPAVVPAQHRTLDRSPGGGARRQLGRDDQDGDVGARARNRPLSSRASRPRIAVARFADQFRRGQNSATTRIPRIQIGAFRDARERRCRDRCEDGSGPKSNRLILRLDEDR